MQIRILILKMEMAFIFDFNWSSLHWAAYQKNKKFCKVLLEFGGDPRQPDYEVTFFIYGITPYLLAQQNGDTELMNLMDTYKSVTSETPLGGCTFLGLCAPEISSNSNLRSIPNDDVDILDL